MVQIKVYIYLFFVSLGTCIDFFSSMDYKLSFRFSLNPLLWRARSRVRGVLRREGKPGALGCIRQPALRSCARSQLTTQMVSGLDGPGWGLPSLQKPPRVRPRGLPSEASCWAQHGEQITSSHRGPSQKGRWEIGQASMQDPLPQDGISLKIFVTIKV